MCEGMVGVNMLSFPSGMVGGERGSPGDHVPSRGTGPPLLRGGGAYQADRPRGDVPPQQAEDTPHSQEGPAQHHQRYQFHFHQGQSDTQCELCWGMTCHLALHLCLTKSSR